MKPLNLPKDKQADIVRHVNNTLSTYKSLLDDYHSRMTEVYNEIKTFKQKTEKDGDVDFKVNKAQEVVNKAMSKIVARPFKRIVSQRRTIDESNLDPKMALAIQDYLTTYFDKSEIKTTIRTWVRGMLNYGMGRCKATYKYRVDRTLLTGTKTITQEDGTEVDVTSNEIKEDVIAEYPTGEYRSYTDIYFDPRVQARDDHVSVIDVTRGVRLGYVLNRPKSFINTDDLKDLAALGHEDINQYRNKVEEITGLNYTDGEAIDLNKFDVTCFYGLYDLKDDSGRGERLYEFRVVAGLLLIKANEITEIPFVPLHCFGDTETFLGTGLVEPIMGLQQELNFKKQRAAEYINQSLYRSYVWSFNSGIDPKKLNGGAGNIIPTAYDGETALNNLREIPHRSLPSEYFSEQNDFERQIQGLTHTIDTSSPRSENALTQTATGIRIKAFESNAVMSMIRQHVEEAVVKLAYKFLKKTFESLNDTENVIINKTDKDGYRKIHREALRDAIARYDLKVEAGYSSFDSIEERRSDAIAKWNIGKDAANSGVQVDLEKLFKQVLETFEGVNTNDIIKQTPIQLMQPMQASNKTITPSAVNAEQRQLVPGQ